MDLERIRDHQKPVKESFSSRRVRQQLEGLFKYYLELVDRGEIDMLRADLEAGMKLFQSED